jgi:hypothetical protein
VRRRVSHDAEGARVMADGRAEDPELAADSRVGLSLSEQAGYRFPCGFGG